jgi:hypothetical protein
MALAYLPDIESDMSAFHRIDDVRDMPAQKFIDLVLRLPSYRGVMRELILALREELDDGNLPSKKHHPSSPARGRDGQEVTHVPGDLGSIATAPAFEGLVEVSRAEEAPDGGQGIQAS